MSRLDGWLYTFRSLLGRNQADRDMADEIELHIDRQARKHESHGLSRDEARQRALTEFGGTTRWREEARHARGSTALDIVERDVRHTVRGLRRDPLFTAMAVVTLALAIGANATMFGIIDRLLIRGPEGVVGPEQLARVYVTRSAPSGDLVTAGWQPYAFYRSLHEQASAVRAVAAYAPNQLRVGTGAESRLVPVVYVTSDFFSLAGARPALGRFYTPDEDRPSGGEPVVVLGYRYWQADLAGDSAIIGKSITLGDVAFRVIGVAPRAFTGVELAPVDAWLPMSAMSFNPDMPQDWTTKWQFSMTSIVVRVAGPKSGAESRLTSILRNAYEGGQPGMRTANVSLRPVSYGMDGVEPKEVGVARLLAGVALVMLLVAAANATNLTLARAVRRRRELSVRTALGATRWQIVRLMVAEAVAIALLGGAVGLAIAHWGGAIIRQALLPAVAWGEMPIESRVLLWTVVASVGTGIVVGLIPASRVSRGDVAAALRAGRTGAGSSGESHGRSRTALQIVQLALSVVLLFAAGLFVRSLLDIRRLDLGYDRDRVLSVDLSFPRRVANADSASLGVVARQARYQDLRTRFERLPGVAGVSIAFGSPLSSVNILRVRVPGRDSLPPSKGGRALVTSAAPGYFGTVGTRILRGRSFLPNEGAGSEPVVIINETMAKTIWPDGDAAGRCVVLGRLNAGACARVVGVVQDVHFMNLKEPALSQTYVPWGQDPDGIDGARLLVRASGADAARVVPALNAVLRDVPGLQFAEIKTFEKALDPQVRPWRVGATLFGLFGAIVVAVAAIGLFSVVSYLVTQRTHELGVRIALGARGGHVMRLVLGSGLRTAAIGALLGSVVSIAVGPLLQPLLFDNRAFDPWMLAGVSCALLVVAMVASLWPSWRATRVDPLLAIRAD